MDLETRLFRVCCNTEDQPWVLPAEWHRVHILLSRITILWQVLKQVAAAAAAAIPLDPEQRTVFRTLQGECVLICMDIAGIACKQLTLSLNVIHADPRRPTGRSATMGKHFKLDSDGYDLLFVCFSRLTSPCLSVDTYRNSTNLE